MATKWVYLFEEGDATMRNLLGGKGAGLAEMTRAGLPVPPGFTITTEACLRYSALGRRFPEGLWEQSLAALAAVEAATGKRFGSADNPLLVSVRSGSRFSMPGMMDTVLNLGLNEETETAVARLTGNERFACDIRRRFIQMYGRVVLGVESDKFEHLLQSEKRAVGARLDSELSASDLQRVTEAFERLVRSETGHEFPTDGHQQLRSAIEAVFDSWNNKRAVDYRIFHRIPHDLGTAVNVQAMVFGNMGSDCGTGVAFTRNPSTGENRLYGEYLLNAQGEDVVAGVRTPQKIEVLAQDMPRVFGEFKGIAGQLEKHYRDMQDIEFTVEKGRLWVLQTRSGKRTAPAGVKIAVEMANEGLITRDEAVSRVDPAQVHQLLLPRFDQSSKDTAQVEGRLLAKGLNASPGAATGEAVFHPDRAVELASQGHSVILVRAETSPDDVHGMINAKGVLTSRGGATSHAAVVARGLGKPCVSGVEALLVDPVALNFMVGQSTVREGDLISIDGSTGEVFLGSVATIDVRFSEQSELITLLSWADEIRRRPNPANPNGRGLECWANADYPRDAVKGREFGAEGIGLCRTEHMFFEEERLPVVQRMILAASEATSLDSRLTRLHGELANATPEQRVACQERLDALESEARVSNAWGDYHGSLARLLEMQKQDFLGIFRAMDGLPVIIRLLDPPLHEFLPKHEELLVRVVKMRLTSAVSAELAEGERLLQAVEEMREANPMMGLRGCRLGIMYPSIYEMQVRAIFSAACESAQAGVVVKPEVMIPLVGTANELKTIREQLEDVAQQVQASYGTKVRYKFGTMIEIPRAALTADQIAEYAEFFSFGTNDLTQTTFGYSRDDAENKFLLSYISQGILAQNPFQVLDRDGVGKLMAMTVALGRGARPDIEIGICGEHAGEPSSIGFCYQLGLAYVSASPFRVPIARLAAAQAALAVSGTGERDK